MAQPSAHYVPGSEGLKGATLPPPGIYLRDYNVAYYADRLNNSRGDAIPFFDFNTFVYANVPRLLWITDAQLLGGNLGLDALLPIQYTDLSVGPFFSDSTLGIGDFFLEGTWSRHVKHFDFSLGAGFWAPTGDSSPSLSTRAGLGYWTAMLTAGATWYLDSQQKWAISALNRYEFNTEKEHTDITPGQAYTLEWGVSRALSGSVDVGAVGYYQQHVTGETTWVIPGDNEFTFIRPQNERVVGVGPEISVFYPQVTLGWSLRYVYEFLAENRLQGHTFALTITKRF
jgi:hypothetical protein